MKRRRALASLIGGVLLTTTATAVPAAANPLDLDLDLATSPFDTIFSGDSTTDAYSAFDDYSFDDLDVDFGLDDYSFDDLDFGLDDSYSIDPAWGDDWTNIDTFDLDLNLDDSYTLTDSEAPVTNEDFPFVPAACIFRGQIDGHKQATQATETDTQQVSLAQSDPTTESKGAGNRWVSDWVGRLGRPAHLDDADLNPLAEADHIAENIWNNFLREMIAHIEPPSVALELVMDQEIQHVFRMDGRPTMVEVKACVKNEQEQVVGRVEKTYTVGGAIRTPKQKSGHKSKCDEYETYEGAIEGGTGERTTGYTENNFWVTVYTTKSRSKKRPRYGTTPNPQWPYNPPPPAAGGSGAGLCY